MLNFDYRKRPNLQEFAENILFNNSATKFDGK